MRGTHWTKSNICYESHRSKKAWDPTNQSTAQPKGLQECERKSWKMNLLCQSNERYQCLRPVGDWDETMQAAIDEKIGAGLREGVRTIVIDLEWTDHIKLKALVSLRQLYASIRAWGSECMIVGPNSYQLEILAAGDVPGAIPVYVSKASAALEIDDAPVAPLVLTHEGERGGSGFPY